VIDVREEILARLLEVVATIPNIKTAVRNNVDLTREHLPAAVVFDGDEETSGSVDLSHSPDTVMRIEMTPEVVIVQQADEVGSDITTLRRELIKRVLYDATLIAIVNAGRGGNGAIRYIGCETDVGWMRSLHGALRAQFIFKYMLKPGDL
jgi:hypothetical protein